MLDLSSVSVVCLSVLGRARVRCMELLTAVAKRSGRTKKRVVLIAINVAGEMETTRQPSALLPRTKVEVVLRGTTSVSVVPRVENVANLGGCDALLPD